MTTITFDELREVYDEVMSNIPPERVFVMNEKPFAEFVYDYWDDSFVMITRNSVQVGQMTIYGTSLIPEGKVYEFPSSTFSPVMIRTWVDKD
jgi:hypothetical protein